MKGSSFRRNSGKSVKSSPLFISGIEQSLEWNSSLYITFIDFVKEFDCLDRDSLLKLMQHYGIRGKFITIIKNTYEGTSCKVLHEGTLTDKIKFKTGERQGCLLSPFLFLLAVDWIMKESTEGRRNGIQWTLWKQSDDLVFADDIALLAHTYHQMQEKTTQLEESAAKLGLSASKVKTKSMRMNTTNTTPIMLQTGVIEDVSHFTYLGRTVSTTGVTDDDVKARIGKARVAFSILQKIWKSRDIQTSVKLQLFNSNVKYILFMDLKLGGRQRAC